MPVFDFKCPKGHRFEALIGMTADSSENCPVCGRKARKVVSGGGSLLLRSANLHTMDPKERTMALQNKADIERDARRAISEGRDPAEVVRYHVPKNVGLAPEFVPKV